jgi:hypothetical protein
MWFRWRYSTTGMPGALQFVSGCEDNRGCDYCSMGNVADVLELRLTMGESRMIEREIRTVPMGDSQLSGRDWSTGERAEARASRQRGLSRDAVLVLAPKSKKCIKNSWRNDRKLMAVASRFARQIRATAFLGLSSCHPLIFRGLAEPRGPAEWENKNDDFGSLLLKRWNGGLLLGPWGSPSCIHTNVSRFVQPNRTHNIAMTHYIRPIRRALCHFPHPRPPVQTSRGGK